MECADARLRDEGILESQAAGKTTDRRNGQQEQAKGRRYLDWQATRFPLGSSPAANPHCANTTTAEHPNSAQRITSSQQDLLRPVSIRVEVAETCRTECAAARDFEFACRAFRDDCVGIGFSSSELWNGFSS